MTTSSVRISQGEGETRTVFDLHPSPPEARTRVSLELALELADAVRRNHRDDIQSVIDRADTAALALILAAMVDDERSIRGLLQDVPKLLRWLDRPRDPKRSRHVLKPCGTHAAFTRHISHGEPVDEVCREAERAYQRARTREKRRAS